MLLRSSSTPVLGSLIPSFSESPNNILNHHHHYEAKPNPTLHHNHNKLSIHQSWHLNHTTFSANSSPIPPSKGFRRAQSDGNLAGLAYDASSCGNKMEEDQFSCDSPITNNGMFTRRPKCLTLETIPSFSLHNSGCGFDEDDEQEEENDIDCLGLEERAKKSMSVTQEVRVKHDSWDVGFGEQNEKVGQGLSVEKGIGIGGGDGGGGGGRGGGSEFYTCGGNGDGGDKKGVEEFYKRMVEENPGNSLFLGNYAQFLYQSKGDIKGAEEYYSRAILADPKDGGVLSHYAKLVWELYNDQDRASSYFETAIQASPLDSHVQAAYANFLWETEDENYDETNVAEGFHAIPEKVSKGFTACAND